MPPTVSARLGETLANQRLMKLVEEALQHPENDRREFLQQQCGANSQDFAQAWYYVEWEQRMQGFLLDPLVKRDDAELRVNPGVVFENRFRIIRQVAQGGMGIVYEAYDDRLGRRIALKCAKAGFGNDLPPEVRHATEVSHPNVCKIYEIHTTKLAEQSLDFITMEFLEGETLLSRLERGRLPREQALAIARQLAAGLAEAHRNGVIHGDIKSNNVVLTKANDGSLRAVITDFGLARMRGAARRGIWGTPGYMAPELWLGEEPSVASDIYALGIVIYEMVTGAMPNRGHSSHAQSTTLKATPFFEVARLKPPSVNAFWDRILQHCLASDPAKRYKNTDQLIAALAPRHIKRNTLLTTAAILAAALTGLVTYKTVTAPPETVKLALSEDGNPALWKNIDREIGRLTGTNKVGFQFFGGSRARATHLLHLSAAQNGGQTLLHAVLSDAQSQASLKTWDALYAPAEWKYAPQALAGVVTSALHLTPLAEASNIRETARSSYLAGLNAIRHNASPDQILSDFEKARVADNDSPLVWAGLAEAEWLKYSRTDDSHWLDRARESERQSELRYLDTSVGRSISGRLEITASKFDDAETDLLRAIELDPANAESYRRLGSAYEGDNQTDRALQAYRKAVELDPNYLTQWSLGRFYLDHGLYQDAVEHISETVRLAPSLNDPPYQLSVAYTETGDFPRALEILNRMPHLSADGHFQLGLIHMYQSKDADAIPHFELAIKEKPTSFGSWSSLAIAQRRTGHLSESLQSMRTALGLVDQQLVENPRDGNARAGLAYACAVLHQKERAESEVKQALQLSPHELNVLWRAVETYEALGLRDQTLALLRSAPPEMLGDLKRWPDMAGLASDPRFIELTAAHAVGKERTR